MLKKVAISDLRIGMFIDGIDGSQLSHPFWGEKFLVTRQSDIEILLESEAPAVVIDTKKGKDVNNPAVIARNKIKRTTHLELALQTIEKSKPLIKDMFENAKVGNAVSIDDATQAVEHIAACMKNGAKALLTLTRLKSRDEYTFLHSISVCALMVHLGRASNLDETTVRNLGIGGLVHDIGKVRINLAILNKPGKLNEREISQIQLHPTIGHKMLSQQGDMPDTVLDICLHHHERLDGKGYPQGLTDEQISMPVRICSICDVYDALTSIRAYKKAWTSTDAARFMFRTEGQFDRKLMTRFFESLNFQDDAQL